MNITVLVPPNPDALDACRRAAKLVLGRLPQVVSESAVEAELKAGINFTENDLRVMFQDIDRYFGTDVAKRVLGKFAVIAGALMAINGQATYQQNYGYGRLL